jgi:hypothetical protein
MVLPGDELTVTVKHVGMRDGNIVVNITTSKAEGKKVLEGTAEVAQPATVYVFTGQGSQEPGMGMDLYNNSPAARAVWEAANAHLLAVYGFSIIEIVKDNPKEKTIHFGGIKGQDIHQRYMEMTYDTMDKDGNVKTLPLFADIDVQTPKYTFSHPNGLLFATQFTQIALIVTEKALKNLVRVRSIPDTTAHAINFGPGGVSGIGPFTACNFEGRGFRVVVGDRDDAVQSFCAVVGNQAEAFKTAIMKAIFPSQIDGDLLRLVYLSNGFRMIDAAKPLKRWGYLQSRGADLVRHEHQRGQNHQGERSCPSRPAGHRSRICVFVSRSVRRLRQHLRHDRIRHITHTIPLLDAVQIPPPHAHWAVCSYFPHHVSMQT